MDVLTLSAEGARSLCWHDDELIDWVAGGVGYRLDGTREQGAMFYAYRFDAAVMSPSGRYAVLYERLGTKGLVLDAGYVVREIDRSYYHAHLYDFPVVLLALPDGREVMAHCPEAYNRLEIEDLATGERLTARETQRAGDFFHSRLAVSPGGTWLLSAGWIWHPFDSVSLYRLPEVLADPSALDRVSDFPGMTVEIASAAFLEENRLVLSSRPDADDFTGEAEAETDRLKPGDIGVYDLERGAWESVAPLEEPAGTLMPVGEGCVMGFYDYPKLIEVATGRVVRRWPALKSGRQDSSLSFQAGPLPPLALDAAGGRFAVADEKAIHVVEVELGTEPEA